MINLRKKFLLDQTYTLERLCGLTDGVYAIVLTLLVLDLKIPASPGLSEAKIVDDLVKQIPNFISYIISFFIIAILWVKHHTILRPLKKCNGTTFGFNFLHLLFVSLTPYIASLFGHYKEDPIVVFLFSGSIGLASVTLHLLHWHIVDHTDWYEDDPPEEWKYPNWLVAYPAIPIALISVSLSFISVTAALLTWIVVPACIILFAVLFKRPNL